MSFKFLLITYVFLCCCIPGITAGNIEFGGDVSQLWNELRELKAVLSVTRLDLNNTRTELGVTKDVLGKELEKTKQVLIETKVLLDITGKKLDKTMESLVDTRQDLADTRRELDETKKWINVNNGQLNVIHKSITAGKREFDDDVLQLWNELRELKAVLSETRLDLHNTRTELGVTKDVLGKELEKTKQVLIETKVLLDLTGKKLDKTMESLVDTRQDLADTRRELDETKKWINVNNGQYNVIHTTNDRKRLIDSTDELHQVQVDMQNLKANLAAVKLQVKTSQIPRIGFTAVLSKDVSNLGDNQVIRFDTVYTNYGSNYNHHTGIFTCAIPGLYAFYVHTLAEPGKHLETEITKNLQLMASTYAYDKEFYSSGSNMAVMFLQIGDTVLVRSHGSEHDHAGSVIDYKYTSFSGFLIAS